MKKLNIVIIMIAIMICLAGCAKVKDENGEYRNSYYELIEIEQISDLNSLLYDPKTKVVYMYIRDGYLSGISPYYVIGENGKPEIAVYGVNYNKNGR